VSGQLVSRVKYLDIFDGKPQRTEYLDGTFETSVYNCCHMTSSMDREGIETIIDYDDFDRVTSRTRAGIEDVTIYDGLGRVVETRRKGTDGVTMTTSKRSSILWGGCVKRTTCLIMPQP